MHKEAKQLKADYAGRGIVELSLSDEIIRGMGSGLKKWIVLQVEPLREVMSYFNPPEALEDVTGNIK